MDAKTVAGALLELNVINTQDLDAQINKLAASLLDERAAKWFRRVARYFIINIEKQRDTPLKAKAKDRGQGASSAYIDPKGTADIGLGLVDVPDDKSWDHVKQVAKRWAEVLNTPGTPSDEAAEVERELNKAVEFVVGQLKERPTSADLLDDEYEGIAREMIQAMSGHPDLTSYHTRNKERQAWTDLNTPTRDKRVAKQLATGESSIVPRLVDWLLEADYETMLHAPVVQTDIEQSFTPFKPAKAKKTRMHGQPPAASELQPWMVGPEAAQKEFHHYDPIQPRKRALWSRMDDLVNYLNWQTKQLRFKQSEDPERRERARSAEMLFRRLATMKTEDLDGFREIMQKSSEFSEIVRERPWVLSDQGKPLRRLGPYTLYRINDPELVKAMGKRQSENGTVPTWCVKGGNYAKDYSAQGPLFFVDKNDAPWVLIHFATGQARDLENEEITAKEAAAIAPLFRGVRVDTQTKRSAGYASGGEGYRELVRHLS